MRKGQKVWYIDHTYNELKIGTLVKTENQSDYDEHPTLLIKGKYCNNIILTDWVFTNERAGILGFRRYIVGEINRKKAEINTLKRKLK